MLTYWIMFLVPAIAALASPHIDQVRIEARKELGLNGTWMLVLVALTLLIGFRYQVGGDWGSYLMSLEEVSRLELEEAISLKDPFYRILEWGSGQLGWGIYGVNLVAGAIFSTGVVVFCRRMPRPWLALAIAVPYMVIVVGMGYTRQSIALGFLLLGLVMQARGKVAWFVFWVLLGAAFHRTAVLLLPVAALAATRGRVWKVLWIGVVAAVTAGSLLTAESDDLIASYYVDTEMQSAGAFVRLLMNVVAGVILVVLRRRSFGFSPEQGQLWFWFSMISIALFGLYFIAPSNVALDRMGLYLLPLQITVYSYVPNVFGTRKGSNPEWIALVLLAYVSVLAVWLNFGHWASYWLPYQFYPLVDLF